jgi:hypothetical protein
MTVSFVYEREFDLLFVLLESQQPKNERKQHVYNVDILLRNRIVMGK